MNYTQMFANGGKTSDQELIKGIQKILGVDDSQMEQLLQIGINKYGSLEGIGQALSQATQSLTQNSSPEEVQAAVASVFQTNAESQMFKCGGKLQQLVSKFGKGGNVDCGCNGVKLGQEGFKTSGSGTDPDAGFHTWDIEVTPQKDTIVRYTYPSYNGKAVLTPNGGTVKEWLNGDSFPAVYRDRNWFNRHPRRALLPFIGNLNDAKVINARELAQNHIPSQQEGGVMLEQMPANSAGISLTRRQARELSQLNKGYNRAQFQTAMLNAKTALRNQGLRGRELRERAREMAAGISPAQRSIVEATPTIQQLPEGFGNVAKITAPAQLVLPETQTLLGSMLDQTNATLTKRLQTSGKRTGDQKPVFVGSTPAPKKAPTPEQQARIARGQAREQASNAARAKAQQAPVQPSQSIVDTPDYTTGYMWTPEASKYYVHASNWSSLFDNPYAVRMPSAPIQQASDSQQYQLTGNERAMAEQVYGYPARKPQASNTNNPINHTTRKGLNVTSISLDSGKYGIDGMPLGRIYQEYVEEQPHITRTGRDDAGNYYEVSDGMAGINANGDYYIRRPLMSYRNQNMVPAGGGNFNWAAFKKGGKIDNLACGKKLSCGGKTKAKEGIKLAKFGKKVKK